MIHFSIELILLGYIASFFVASIAAFMFIRSFTTHTVIHHKLIVISSLCMIIGVNIFIGISLVTRLSIVPQLVISLPKNGQILSYEHPTIQLEFSEPVMFSKLLIHTFPERELEITTNGYLFNMLPFGRTLTVVPKKPFPLNSNIMMYISDTKGPFTQSFGGESLLEFSSETKPKVISIISPALFTDVSTTADIRMMLDKPSKKFIDWTVSSVPESDFSVSVIENEVSVHPNRPLLQGVTYTISLFQKEQQREEFEDAQSKNSTVAPDKTLTFTTTSPPFVSDIYPTGSTILPSEPIQIAFKQPMNKQSVEEHLTLTPNISHSYVWNLPQTAVTIQHEPIQKDSSISAQLASGTTTALGGILEAPLQFNFRTPGTLDIRSSHPANEQKNRSPIEPIYIEFNQPISFNTPVSKSISVTPDFKFSVIASSSSLLISPVEKLKANTLYSIHLSPSIVGTYGLPSDHPLSISFSTQPEQILLPVPFYKQESSFTCNIAAVRMLLAYKNIVVSEKEIIQSVGSGGKRGSGNPNIGYIDDYGTYWNAISKGISRYSRNTIIHNGSLQEIISKIISGTPVMIWGQNGWSDPHEISWTSSTGEFIRAINGMHSSVVTGFKGPPNKPVEIYLNDPWRGQYSIPTAEFLRRWGYFSIALSLDE